MPATLQSPGEHESLDNTMGAMLLGVIFSAVLFGISVVQSLYYFNKYSRDPWILKALVGLTVLFDAMHQIFITHTVYHYLVYKYYDPTALNKIVWSVVIEAIPTGVTGGLVQCFYTLRVWRLSKRNYLLTGTILLFIIANSVCGTVWVVLAMYKDTYAGLLEITALTMTINGLSVAADILIAGSLCLMLNQSRTGFRNSDTMITRLTVFFVNTGLLTSLCAIGALVSLAVSSNTLIYAVWYFCIGRLYANSLLAALNARNIIRGRAEDVDMLSFPTAIQGSGLSVPTNSNSNSRTPNISIRIETMKEYDSSADIPMDQKMKMSPSDSHSYIEQGP